MEIVSTGAGAAALGSPLLSVEVRHLGGAIARPSAAHGALSHFDDEYLMFAVGIAPQFLLNIFNSTVLQMTRLFA